MEPPETSQLNTLGYAMGDEADDILTSLKLTEAQKSKYDRCCQAEIQSLLRQKAQPDIPAGEVQSAQAE